MPDFSKLPMDIVYNILTYSNHVKERNGKLIFQIPKNDPRINMILEKYRRINKLDNYYMDNPKLVVRFLNSNHYIRSSYRTIKEKNTNNFPYRGCICIQVVKFERFKNGNIKQKSQVEKYSHLIMDTH
jgi:hypothetical protein